MVGRFVRLEARAGQVKEEGLVEDRVTCTHHSFGYQPLMAKVEVEAECAAGTKICANIQ